MSPPRIVPIFNALTLILFGAATALALLAVYQYYQSRPHIISSNQAMDVATAAFEKSMIRHSPFYSPSREVNASLYHTLKNGTSYLVDLNSGREYFPTNGPSPMADHYFWCVSVSNVWYIVDAENGQLISSDQIRVPPQTGIGETFCHSYDTLGG